MTIEKNYRDNEFLRNSFNELAGKVFGGLNFEDWYRNGFWKDNYIPYSVVVDGKVVANVSVNACDMNYAGRIVKLIQLGTVMTDPDYRGRGYARLLMERLLRLSFLQRFMVLQDLQSQLLKLVRMRKHKRIIYYMQYKGDNREVPVCLLFLVSFCGLMVEYGL